MNCEIKVSSVKAFNALGKRIGLDVRLQTTMFLEATDNGNYTQEFIDWYKTKYKTDIVPDLKSNTPATYKKVAGAIYDYYYYKYPSVPASANINAKTDAERYGYASIFDRDMGKQHVATIILDAFNENQKVRAELPDNRYKYYKDLVKDTWLKLIFTVVNKTNGTNMDKLQRDYENVTDKAAYIDKILGGKEKSNTGANYYAVYQELFGTDKHAIDYIVEVFSTNKLKTIFSEIGQNVDEEYAKIQAEQDGDTREDASESTEENQPDEGDSMGRYDHSGIYNDFSKHVSARILNYFNSLRRLNSTSITDINTGNIYGLPETMDAAACIIMMYSNNEGFLDRDSMINAIRRIGETVKGFEAFVRVAKDLTEDLDLATEFFTVFVKDRMDRAEMVVDGSNSKFDISNKKANRRSAFIFDLMNDIKGSINNNEHTTFAEISKIKFDISNIKKKLATVEDKFITEADKKEAISTIDGFIQRAVVETTTLLKSYFPSIQENAVSSYINTANRATTNRQAKVDNLLSLLSDIENTAKNTETSRKAYDNMIFAVKQINKQNSYLKSQEASGKWVKASKYKSVNDIISDDYTQSQRPAILSLADKLNEYSIVNIDLNSRNVHGNNNSAIINSSWLTGIKKLFEQTYTVNTPAGKVLKNDALIEWGKKKLGSKQYKYSNLLVEQTDEQGNVLNNAIFRYVNSELVLTENAEDVFKIVMFGGASNMDSSNNALYTAMTSGDMIPSSYMAFFNTVNKDAKIPIASYFLRTPSDAPKTFTVQGARYNTDSLFKVKDEKAFDATVDEITTKLGNPLGKKEIINTYTNVIAEEDGNKPQFETIETSEYGSYLKPSRSILIQNTSAIRKIEGTENTETGSYEAYLTCANPKTGDTIILRGQIIKAGRGSAIAKAKLVGTTNLFNLDNPTIPSDFYDIIRSNVYNHLIHRNMKVGDITYKTPEKIIDTNHPVFKMIKNQFKQEILDAGNALHHYFEFRDNGDGTYSVRIHKGKPIFNANTNNTLGYKNYHLGKDKKVLIFKNGKYEMQGNVFHSLKFTLAKVLNTNGKETVSKHNYFDGLFDWTDVVPKDDSSINLLYGGGLSFILSETEHGKTIVGDVKFSDTLDARVDEALSEFLIDYRNSVAEALYEYNGFVKNTSLSFNNITEYAMNNLLMFFNYDEMLEGSSKFYTDSQDLLKRAKECQASGVPYGIANYTPGFVPNLNEVEKSYLNSEEVQNILDKIPDLRGTKQRNGFTAVTIANTQTTNSKVLASLAKQLVANGATQEQADSIMYGPLKDNGNGEMVRNGGYQNTKVNDAQSYITYPEFVRRIAARGQLKRYLPLLEKVADESKHLSAEDLNEFIQVQKNIYYDMFFDDRYNMEVPRQIKNAEFVLVPRFIRGTELAAVYNMMMEAGIDQLNTVETSKAANEEVLILWDNDGNLVPDVQETFVSKAKEAAKRNIFSYNNLYTQQETPQHMNDENKFSIQIAKKILDNITEDNKTLWALKQQYFDLLDTNISESARDFYVNFDIPIDENGNIKLEDGELSGINRREFFSKLRDEIIRVGADSNLIDFVTLDENGVNTKMPVELNNVAKKFESICQALTNNRITRQTLPGFHGVQITNVGWKALNSNPTPYVNKKDANDRISKEAYDKLDEKTKKQYKDTRVTYDANLEYHPGNKGYIQVKVPYSFLGIDRNSKHYRNMSDEEILAELRAERDKEDSDLHGLDSIIGYRIPTEGKQSICNMVVVGFIDDSLGSSIVVPDDWVSQTGSDFDVDSVYAIQFETYKTRDGQIHKVKYKKQVTERDWFNYIMRFAKETLSDNTNNAYKNAQAFVKNKFDEMLDNYSEKETEIWDSFSKEQQSKIKKVQAGIKEEIERRGLKGNEARLYRLDKLSDYLKQLASKEKAKDATIVDKVKKFLKVHKEINSLLDDRSTIISENTQYVYDALKEPFNKAAKEAGLMTLEEFLDPANNLRTNGREGRNTRILEIMQDIMADPSTLEENLSRSNFDILLENRDEYMNENVKKERAARSPYNIIDQIHYQEEAMSGAKLKARSVILDTFCSICNSVQPELNSPIYIVYNKKDFDDPAKAANRFGVTIPKDGDTFAVRHKSYGFSADNRNISGWLLTAYSSQTTAYILDAIKSGSIPNVNEFTFTTWKTLVNAGSDYKTALSFIMQPGITEITKAYNANNSVFNDGRKINPIHEAIKNIASRLDIEVDEDAPITALLAAVNKKYGKEFNKLFRQKDDKDITIGLSDEDLENLPIVVQLLVDRLKNTGKFSSSTPVEETLFDLGVALSFYKLNKTARQIDDITSCCNPDKFGAKQSFFATRQVFKNIRDCIYSTETSPSGAIYKKRTPVLTVKGEHILESIYPGLFDETLDIHTAIEKLATSTNDKRSIYPTLHSFLKYASASSCIVGKTLFATEDPRFIEFVEHISTYFSSRDAKLTEDTYNSFKKYVLSDIFNHCPSVQFPITVRSTKNGLKLTLKEKVTERDIKNETARIYGYNHRNDLSIRVDGKIVEIKIADLNNPTNDEMELFEQLSPAQKVQFIKTHFSNPGLFSYINATLFNGKERKRTAGMQTLEYEDKNVSTDAIYTMFKQAFSSNNPLITSTAIDIIKYAFKVEGFNMSKRAVNKVIANDVLRNEFGTTGLGFVQYFRDEMNKIGTKNGIYSSKEASEEIYENYLRSHLDDKNIRTIYLSDKNKKKYGMMSSVFGAYILEPTNEKDTIEANKKAFNDMLVSMGIKGKYSESNGVYTNKYVKIKEKGQTHLYKIKDFGDYIIVYPLSKLEVNENTQWSANEDNNEDILSKQGYEAIITDYKNRRTTSAFNSLVTREFVKSHEITTGVESWIYKKRNQERNIPTAPFSIEELAKTKGGTWSNLKSEIINHFSTLNGAESLYVNKSGLSDYIKSTGAEYGSAQEIKFSNGTRKFKIVKPDNIDKLAEAFLTGNKQHERLSYTEIKNNTLRPIVKELQAGNTKRFDNLFEITPLDADINTDLDTGGTMASTYEEVGATIAYAEGLVAHQQSKPAKEFIDTMRMIEDSNSFSSMKERDANIVRAQAKLAVDMRKYIENDLFSMFVKDPNNADAFISITDPRVRNMIKNDPILYNKYLHAINSVQAYLDQYSQFYGFNVESEDKDIEFSIKKIQESVNEINKLPIKDMTQIAAEVIAANVSTNPNIQNQIIDVLSGFWKTYGSMYKFNDVMENGTPILQIILKDVMGDLDAKKKTARKIKKAYRAKIAEIKARAKAEGYEIDVDKLVNADGRWVRKYKQEFAEKFDELAKNLVAAKAKGLGSIEHLKAKLEYDEFKSKYINQEAKPEYYIRRCAMERLALYGGDTTIIDKDGVERQIHINAIPELYSKYMQLIYRRRELLNSIDDDTFTPEEQKLYDDITFELKNLYSDEYFWEGEFKERPHYDSNGTYIAAELEHLKLYSDDSANNLWNFLNARNELDAEYFENKPVYGFKELLKANLEIVRAAEKPVNGVPTVDRLTLQSNPEYVKAKTWLRKNAKFVIKETGSVAEGSMTIGDRLKLAFKTLGLGRNNKNHEANKIMKDHNGGKGIKDEHGIPDGRLLSDDEIRQIKEQQVIRFGLKDFPPFSDRVLIKNASPIDDQFSADFYSGMIDVNNRDNANFEYIAAVTELNKILEKYYIVADRCIHLENIPDTDEGITELKRIGELYQKIRDIKGTHKSNKVKNFIQRNVEFKTNTNLWFYQNGVIADRNVSQEFQEAWNEMAYEKDKNGNFIQVDGKFIPNRFLYSYAKPKGNKGDASYDAWVDNKKRDAKRLVDDVYVKVPTQYYSAKLAEELAKKDADPTYDYEAWYNANHVYNPYTRKMEPLDCWVTTEINPEYFEQGLFEGGWEAKTSSSRKQVIDGIIRIDDDNFFTDENVNKRNMDYNPDANMLDNYVKGSQGGIYDSEVTLNKYEQELQDYLMKLLQETATVDSAKRFFKKGYLPQAHKAKAVTAKSAATEALKLLGLGISTNNGGKPFRNDDDITYAKNEATSMPMTRLLNNKHTIDLKEKLKELNKRKLDRDDYESDEDYNDAVDELENEKQEIKDQIKAERQDIINRDWISVIENYLDSASNYNAIVDNKEKLYFLLNVLNNMKMYSRKYGMSGDLKQTKGSTEENKKYEESIDKDLIETYKNFIRRLVFDQWKENEGKAVQIANNLQGFTSANYMMLNLKGGFANITLGETGIIAEALAGEYFDHKDWLFGTGQWMRGQVGFARAGYHMMFNHEEIAYNKQDAIIRYMNVVDYDEKTGVCRELSLEEYSKKVRDLMFSPQTIGEHFMQNSVLFSMMYSHKLITTVDGRVIPMTKRRFIEYKQAMLLHDVLNEEQLAEYEEFKKKITDDKDVLKDYAWYRKDSLSEFIRLHCTKAQIDEFIAKRKEQQKEFEKEFDEKVSLYDQVELGEDGQLAFIPNTELAALDTVPAKTIGYDIKVRTNEDTHEENATDKAVRETLQNVTQAVQIMGQFAEKVRKVNNKIHGIYNRLGAASIEKKWYGSLVMQYHKHIPIGLLKRMRSRGHWNEFRESVDKGMVQSIVDLISLNARAVKNEAGLTDKELGTLEAITFMLTHSFDYISQMKTTWALAPSYDKANIMRNFGDAIGVIGAIATTAALWYIAKDEPDVEDSLWFNFFLYESDRLCTEAFMYNPWGMINETKKLMSTPIAGMSIINDAALTISGIAQWILDPDYEPYYKTGRFAGENPVWVYIQRRMPMWNGIRGIIDLPTNNHYYKVGATPITGLNIKEKVMED